MPSEPAARPPRGAGAFLLALALACGLAALPAPAVQPEGADPVATPFLAVETGGHLARIRALVASADGTRAVTAAPDRTIRVWDSVDGRLVRTLRLPLGPGRIGDPEAIEVSGSGRSILAASLSFDLNGTGHDYSIYLLDVETGTIKGRRQTGLDRAPLSMDFSEGNRWLALAQGDRGLEVLRGNLQDATPPLRDTRPGDSVLQAVFTTRERIGVVTARGEILLYRITAEAELQILGRTRVVAGREPHRIAFSPDGRMLAVSYLDRAAVDVFDGVNLKHLRTLAPKGDPEGNIAALGWIAGADGRPWLAAGGTLTGPDGRNLVLAWRDAKGEPATLEAASDSITAIAPAGTDALLFASSDTSLGRIALPGRGAKPAMTWADPPLRHDFRAGGTSLAVSADGRRVLLPLGDGRATGFDLGALVQLDASASADPDARAMRIATTIAGTLSLTGWRGGDAPLYGGRTLRRTDGTPALAPGERILGADIDAGSGRLLAGTDFHLLLFDRDGREAARLVTDLPAWGVALAEDGRMAVAALGDGTIRWYRITPAGLAERAAVFLHADGTRWVAWRPDGAFAHSDQGGSDLVGYHVNGTLAALGGKWAPFGSLYEVFYRPERVARALDKTKGPDLPALAAKEPVLLRPRIAQLGYCAHRAEGVDWTARALKFLPPAATAPDADKAVPPPPDVGVAGEASCGAVDPVVLGLTRAVDGADGAVLPEGYDALTLAVAIHDTGGGVTRIDAMLDGRLAGSFALSPIQQAAAATAEGLLTEVTVPLDAGRLNRVVLRAYNRAGVYAEGETLRFLTRGAIATALDATLHILAIGVDAYPAGDIMDLAFAVKDARTVAGDIARLAVPAYARIAEPVVLTDAAATRGGILAALATLAAVAKQGDAVVVYLAGHAVTDEGRYVFITPETPERTREAVLRHGILDGDLQRALGNIVAGNLLVVLDTCYAGGFTVEAPDRLAHATGRYVLTATKSEQYALDHAPGTDNGFFAAVVRRGLFGEAVMAGTVDALSLGAYVQRALPRLLRELGRDHRQNAVFKASGELGGFPLAVPGG